MIVKQMELENGRGLACDVSTLPQQACTFIPVGVMLPWCEDRKVPHQALDFICEVVWLSHHTFSNHLRNPLGGIPLSVWSIPSFFLVLWFSQRPRGAVCVYVCRVDNMKMKV